VEDLPLGVVGDLLAAEQTILAANHIEHLTLVPNKAERLLNLPRRGVPDVFGLRGAVALERHEHLLLAVLNLGESDHLLTDTEDLEGPYHLQLVEDGEDGVAEGTNLVDVGHKDLLSIPDDVGVVE
jgi:hypothetical protein